MARPRKDGTHAPGTNQGGAPTKYTEEWIEEEARRLLDWIANDTPDKIYIGSFARYRGYDRARLSEFARSNSNFARAMRQAQAWQEEKFLRNALSKEWDAAQVRYTMARVCSPEWKASWDKEEKEEAPPQIIQHVVRYADIPKESHAKAD
jgi:hypothetical protein